MPDRNSITYSRSAGQVLNVVYLSPEKRDHGGFFPAAANGSIDTGDKSG